MPARPATPCPRCDYDLSGARDSWTDSCPLDGRCPECGLDVRWAEVLNPALTYPKWSFEHAQGRLPRRLIETLARTLWPWGFWRSIRMEHPIVSNRLGAVLVAWALFAHLVICIGAAGISVAYTHEQAWLVARPQPVTGADLRAGVLSWAAWPYRFAEARSVSDGSFYMLPLLTLAVVFACPIAFAPLGATLRTSRVRGEHLWRVAAYSASVPIALIFARSLLSLAADLERFDIVVWPDALTFVDGYRELANEATVLALLGTPLSLIVVWWVACKRYLRIPHAPGVAFAIVTIAALGIGVLIVAGRAIWSP